MSLAANRQPNQLIVGFAAEDSEDIARARQKLERKGVDLIVRHDVADATLAMTLTTMRS